MVVEMVVEMVLKVVLVVLVVVVCGGGSTGKMFFSLNNICVNKCLFTCLSSL